MQESGQRCGPWCCSARQLTAFFLFTTWFVIIFILAMLPSIWWLPNRPRPKACFGVPVNAVELDSGLDEPGRVVGAELQQQDRWWAEHNRTDYVRTRPTCPRPKT